MNVAIDIDGCITEYPKVFACLLQLLSHGCHITIITNREPGTEEEIVEELKTYGIFENDYDLVVITDKKADFIVKNGIDLFIENTDEYFQKLPSSVCVMKVREDGNFNYDTGRWIYGRTTGENLT